MALYVNKSLSRRETFDQCWQSAGNNTYGLGFTNGSYFGRRLGSKRASYVEETIKKENRAMVKKSVCRRVAFLTIQVVQDEPNAPKAILDGLEMLKMLKMSPRVVLEISFD